MMRRKGVLYLCALLLFLSFSSCSVLDTFQNIARLKFKLGNVGDFLLSGVRINGKSQLKDFTASEVLSLSRAVADRKLPASFIINVEALNPNSGSGGAGRTDLTLKSFPWRLYIDDKETISGNISSPIYVPGKGESTLFPLQVNMDLFQFFGNRDYQSLIDLALSLGGMNRSSTRLKLVAQPTISSPVGDITYPRELTIVEKEYN